MAECDSRKLTRLAALSMMALMVSSLAVADKQPSGCAENASADTGQPVMFQRGRLTWGLSTRPVTYGDKLLVLLWIYNPSDEPSSVATCSDIDFFWLRDIEILDSAGKNVVSRAEEKRRAQEGRSADGRRLREPLELDCARNFPITVPSHTCLQGSFSNPQYDFARDLNDYYLLPPGRYSLVPTSTEKLGSVSPAMAGRSPELQITVRKP